MQMNVHVHAARRVDNWMYFVSVGAGVRERWSSEKEAAGNGARRNSDRQKEIPISQRMIRLISYRDETRETAD